jgi:hypothetical protein
MLVVEHPGFGPREIWSIRDTDALPLHIAPMITTPHATEGDPLTDTLTIDSRHHGMSLRLPLFCVAICVLLYNSHYNPPLHPAHPHLVTEGHAHARDEAIAITIGQTSIIGLIVTEVGLGLTEVVLLLALLHNHDISKAQSHLAHHPAHSNKVNP